MTHKDTTIIPWSLHAGQPPQPEQDQTLPEDVPAAASTDPVASSAGVTTLPPHTPGATDHDFAEEAVPRGTAFADEGPLPAPTGGNLLRYQVHAVLDRLVAITDNLAEIDHDMQDIAYRQGVITRHIRAIKYHLE